MQGLNGRTSSRSSGATEDRLPFTLHQNLPSFIYWALYALRVSRAEQVCSSRGRQVRRVWPIDRNSGSIKRYGMSSLWRQTLRKDKYSSVTYKSWSSSSICCCLSYQNRTRQRLMWKQNTSVRLFKDEGREDLLHKPETDLPPSIPCYVKLLFMVSFSMFYTIHVSAMAHIRWNTEGRLVCAPVSHPVSSRPQDEVLVNGM